MDVPPCAACAGVVLKEHVFHASQSACVGSQPWPRLLDDISCQLLCNWIFFFLGIIIDLFLAVQFPVKQLFETLTIS